LIRRRRAFRQRHFTDITMSRYAIDAAGATSRQLLPAAAIRHALRCCRQRHCRHFDADMLPLC